MNSKKILFVDDEVNVLDGFKRLFHYSSDSWTMKYVQSGRDALELLSKEHFDIIVADYRMPLMDGIALLKKVQQLYPEVKRILLTGQSEEELFQQSKTVVQAFLAKPCSKEELVAVIEKL